MLKKTKTNGRYRFLYLYIIVLSAIFFAAFYLYQYKDLQAYYDLVIAANKASMAEISRLSFLEAKKKEPVYINLPTSSPIRAIVQNYNSPSSLWVLVNKSRPIPASFVPSELSVPNLPSAASLPVRSDIITSLTEMFDSAKASRIYLKIASAYRSYDSQQSIFNTSAASVGVSEANKLIALPGQSEHQTGLALDIASIGGGCYIEECFKNTTEGKWLAANSYRYGFILRYPEDKEPITGYSFEPWHFRYVGKDLASALHASNMTLDEAWPYLREALTTLVSNGAIKL